MKKTTKPTTNTTNNMSLTFQKGQGLQPVGEIEIPDIFYNRYKTGLEEFDNLVGGGLLPGSTITFCARGGLGKTTLMMQVMESCVYEGYNSALFTGEQSREQVAFNSPRLNVRKLPVDSETDVDKICQAIEENDLKVVTIDSFQHLTMPSSGLSGRKLQKAMTDKLINCAQENYCVIIFIMHVTVAGTIKGGTYTPHTVDVNMELRSGEDEYGDKRYRILETSKNRFGCTTEVVTTMGHNGHVFTTVDDRPTKSAEPKVNVRTAKKQAEFDQILQMVDPPAITPERVMEALEVDYNHAYGRLAELTKNSLLEKFGRGQDAIFKLTDG
jgi:predicted ATP-dependent serine protease